MKTNCPFCEEEGRQIRLRYLGDGIVYCEECGELDGIEVMAGRYWPVKDKKLRSKETEQ